MPEPSPQALENNLGDEEAEDQDRQLLLYGCVPALTILVLLLHTQLKVEYGPNVNHDERNDKKVHCCGAKIMVSGFRVTEKFIAATQNYGFRV